MNEPIKEKLPSEKTEDDRLLSQVTERTPEEAAFMMRLRVFTTLRWFTILGIAVATLIASFVFKIRFPTIPVYVICYFMVLYNFILFRQVKGLEKEKPDSVVSKVRTYSNIHIILDLVTSTVLLHFTGGIENPFIFFLVLHIIAASVVLPYKTAYLLATLAIFMVVLLVVLEYTGVIPHVNLAGFTSPDLYREVSYLMAVTASLATIIYAATYVSTAVSGELRKRQRQVVQLRESLLAEKTVQLEAASGEIVQLQQEKESFLRFIGIAAHDLKAPLTAIQGFLWVMLGGFSGELNEKQRNMMERSSHRITELLRLISDLLDIPRIETGQIIPEMKEISLNQVVAGAVEEQRHLAEEKGLQLKVEMPADLPNIIGSAPRLQQVLTNLLNNAINYTSSGSVTVRVTEQPDDLLIEIMDTGIGITAQDFPKVFEDFFRGSNVEGRKGTGLGLSITKRIIEAHGGKIWVESPYPESNTGSKFCFRLPKRGNISRRQQ